VLAAWMFGLGLLSVALTSVVALLLGATGFSWTVLARGAGETMLAIAPLYLVMPLVALFAVLGRGYLAPMLFSLGTVFFSNALVASPISPWIPWNMPLHMVGASWYPVPPVGLASTSWVAALLIFAAGVALLVLRLDRADVR
jgi:hypothetical protein